MVQENSAEVNEVSSEEFSWKMRKFKCDDQNVSKKKLQSEPETLEEASASPEEKFSKKWNLGYRIKIEFFFLS